MNKQLLLRNWIGMDLWSGGEDLGISLHASKQDHDMFIKDHWAKYPDSPVPDYYVSPNPYVDPKWVSVSDELFELVCRTPHGMRFDELPVGVEAEIA